MIDRPSLTVLLRKRSVLYLVLAVVAGALSMLLHSPLPIPIMLPLVARTWSAAGAGVWSDPDHWTPNGVPADGDSVTFDGTSTQNCTIDVPTAHLAGFTIAAGYTGAISASAQVNVDSAPGSSFSIAAGTFQLNAQTLVVDGTLTRTGGTINAGSGLIRMGDDFTATAGFTHGTSTVEFFRNADIAPGGGGGIFWNLIVDAGVSVTMGAVGGIVTVDNVVTVNGTLVIGTGAVFTRLILRNMNGTQNPIILGPSGMFFGEPLHPDSALISFQNAGTVGSVKQPLQYIPGGRYVSLNFEFQQGLTGGRVAEYRLTGDLIPVGGYPPVQFRFTGVGAGQSTLLNTQNFKLTVYAVDTAGGSVGDYGIESNGGEWTITGESYPNGLLLGNGFWHARGTKIILAPAPTITIDGTTPTYNWDDVELVGTGPISFVKNITTRSILARASATISPSAGITWTLKAGASLSASPGNLLTLQSAAPPSRFFVAAQSNVQAVRVSLRDVDASQGARIYAFDPEDVDAGNNVNVVFRSRTAIADIAGGAISEVHFLTRTASVLNPAVPADHQRYVYFMKQWSREPDAVVVSVYENLGNVLTIKDQQLLLPNQTIPTPRDGPRPQAVMVFQASSFPQVELSGATVMSGVGLQLFYEDRSVGAKPLLPIQVQAPR